MVRQMDTTAMANIRLLHAAPGVGPVDVYVDDVIYKRNLAFGGITNYSAVPGGRHTVTIYPVGTKENPIINTTAVVPPGGYFTLCAVLVDGKGRLISVMDRKIFGSEKFGYVRFINLSPDAGMVDVYANSRGLVFNDVPYLGITDYEAFKPGELTVQIKSSADDATLLIVPGQTTKAGRLQSFYFIGLTKGAPEDRVIVTVDAGTYL